MKYASHQGLQHHLIKVHWKQLLAAQTFSVTLRSLETDWQSWEKQSWSEGERREDHDRGLIVVFVVFLILRNGCVKSVFRMQRKHWQWVYSSAELIVPYMLAQLVKSNAIQASLKIKQLFGNSGEIYCHRLQTQALSALSLMKSGQSKCLPGSSQEALHVHYFVVKLFICPYVQGYKFVYIFIVYFHCKLPINQIQTFRHLRTLFFSISIWYQGQIFLSFVHWFLS